MLWLAVRDAPSALHLLRRELCGASLPPPPLALKVRDACISLSHDPVDGGSFGMRICGAIVSAGDVNGDPLDRWAEACHFYEVQPQHPWRHPSKVDPFSVLGGSRENVMALTDKASEILVKFAP